MKGSGKEGQEGQLRSTGVMLWLTCDAGQRTLSLMTDQRMEQGLTQVRVKLDSSPPVTMSAFRGSGTVLFDQSSSPIDSLMGHGHVLFEYAPEQASKTIAEFDLRGLDTMRRKLDPLCASP